jgi:outer membrane protein
VPLLFDSISRQLKALVTQPARSLRIAFLHFSLHCLAAFSLSLVTLPSAAQTTPVEASDLNALTQRARALIDEGQAETAYALLNAEVARFAGIPRYDYLLGISAIEAKRPGQAILALERVLAVEPNNLQARAEIGRAYFQAREPDAARRELATVAQQPIPAPVKATINRYLDAINKPELDNESKKTSAFVEFSIGYDSNLNLGSSLSEWIAGDGTRLIPDASVLSQSGLFSRAQFGLTSVHQITPSVRWFWSTGADLRLNEARKDVNSASLDVSTGLSHRTGCHNSSMNAIAQQAWVSGARFRASLGAVAQWQCDLSDRTQIGLFTQGFNFNYAAQPLRDSNRILAGLTAGFAPAGPAAPVFALSLSGGRERAKDISGEFSYRINGARASANFAVNESTRLFSSVSMERRAYDGVQVLFAGQTRKDRELELRFGAERTLGANWVLAPQIIITKNRSSIGPNTYQRSQVTLNARYRL